MPYCPLNVDFHCPTLALLQVTIWQIPIGARRWNRHNASLMARAPFQCIFVALSSPQIWLDLADQPTHPRKVISGHAAERRPGRPAELELRESDRPGSPDRDGPLGRYDHPHHPH